MKTIWNIDRLKSYIFKDTERYFNTHGVAEVGVNLIMKDDSLLFCAFIDSPGSTSTKAAINGFAVHQAFEKNVKRYYIRWMDWSLSETPITRMVIRLHTVIVWDSERIEFSWDVIDKDNKKTIVLTENAEPK